MLCVLRLVKAWPHEWLLHPFWSSAGPAKGPTGRQFGSRVVQVWPKDRLKRPLLEKRDAWPKLCYLHCFRTAWVDLGRHWAARGCPWKLHGRLKTPLCQYGGTRVQLGSMETVANERERMEMVANKSKIKPLTSVEERGKINMPAHRTSTVTNHLIHTHHSLGKHASCSLMQRDHGHVVIR